MYWFWNKFFLRVRALSYRQTRNRNCWLNHEKAQKNSPILMQLVEVQIQHVHELFTCNNSGYSDGRSLSTCKKKLRFAWFVSLSIVASKSGMTQQKEREYALLIWTGKHVTFYHRVLIMARKIERINRANVICTDACGTYAINWQP